MSVKWGPIMQVYTSQEIADILKVSEKTVVRQIKNGWLKAFKVARVWRITEEAFQDYVTARTLKFKRK